MYPATGLASGYFTAEDLPDAITLLGVGSLSRSGTSYGNTTNGVIFETDVWAKYIGEVRTWQSCLITGDGNFTPGDNAVEDQFAATYQFQDPSAIGYVDGQERDYRDVTVTRVSLCGWAYKDEFFEVVVYYGASGSFPDSKWGYSGIAVFVWSDVGGKTSGSSPVGVYTGLYQDVTIAA